MSRGRERSARGLGLSIAFAAVAAAAIAGHAQQEAAPILIDVDGQPQVVVLGGQTVNGLNPDTGEILWSHPHDRAAT